MHVFSLTYSAEGDAFQTGLFIKYSLKNENKETLPTLPVCVTVLGPHGSPAPHSPEWFVMDAKHARSWDLIF